MLPEFLLLNRRASMSFDVLTAAEREQVKTRFTELAGLPAEELAAKGARRLRTDDGIYVVKVHPNLLAFFLPLSESRIIIDDFVRQDFLDSYAAQRRPKALHA